MICRGFSESLLHLFMGEEKRKSYCYAKKLMCPQGKLFLSWISALPLAYNDGNRRATYDYKGRK